MPTPDDDAATTRLALDGLLADAPTIAGSLPSGFADALQRYVALLLDANRRVNLTRVTLPADVARLHLLDALAALPLLDRWAPARAIDLGSGGGIPAIPLALARPEIAWTLVDSAKKKAAILRGFADTLGIRNMTIAAERAETLGRDSLHREQHDLVTARACAPLPVLAELALPLLAVGGRLLAWKGPLIEQGDELQQGRRALAEVGGGEPRLTDPALPPLGDRRFVMARKERATSVRYPRRPGEPARRPLG